MRYLVVLKNVKVEGERIVLAEAFSKPMADQQRRTWRQALGPKWQVERRPGMDMLGHLALTIEEDDK